MKISLVLATLDRSHAFANFIEHLKRQSWQAIELVVVDQSCDDEADLNQRVVAQLTECPVIYIRTQRRGLSRARNLGLTHVSGHLVGFPDDDCWYPRQFLESVAAKFTADPQLTILTGSYTEPGVRNRNFPSSPMQLNGLRGAQTGSSVTTFIRLADLSPTQLEFDESLGAGTSLPIGEETDLIFRLLMKGFQGTYDPSICAYHKIDRGVSTLARSLAVERAYGYLLGKNMDRILLVHFVAGVLKLTIRAFCGQATLAHLRSRVLGFWSGVNARTQTARGAVI